MYLPIDLIIAVEVLRLQLKRVRVAVRKHAYRQEASARWVIGYRLFERGGGAMRSLILSETQHISYPGSRLSPEVDAIIALAIRDTYCLYGWATLDNILLTVAYCIQAVNQTRQKHEQLRLSARSTMYRRVKAAAHCKEMNPPGSAQSA